MATKLFKIGESSFYGKWRITVDKKAETILAQGIDWDTNFVKEGKCFYTNQRDELREYLENASTSFWADKMMEFVERSI